MECFEQLLGKRSIGRGSVLVQDDPCLSWDHRWLPWCDTRLQRDEGSAKTSDVWAGIVPQLCHVRHTSSCLPLMIKSCRCNWFKTKNIAKGFYQNSVHPVFCILYLFFNGTYNLFSTVINPSLKRILQHALSSFLQLLLLLIRHLN